MARRVFTAILLLAILTPAVLAGGTAFFILAALFIGIATWEYCQMFLMRGFQPSPAVTTAGVLFVLAARAFGPQQAGAAVALTVLLSMGYHVVRYEMGRDEAVIDLAVTLGGILYLGWIGAYLLDLRGLPDGAWWLVLVLVIVWTADSAAYFIGVRFGQHKLAVRLSPRKSWEGYWAGVLCGTAAASLLGYVYGRLGGPEILQWQALGLGLVLSTLTTLGDLGESLIKRFAGMKDSGNLLPGHGGAFDRIDSLIWAGVLGYYWMQFIMM